MLRVLGGSRYSRLVLLTLLFANGALLHAQLKSRCTVNGESSPDPVILRRMPDGQPIYKLGGWGMMPPRAKHTPNPLYPDELKAQGVEGTVVLDTVVDATGQVFEASIVRRLHPDLDSSAADAVKSWTFKPATLSGEPVAVCVNIEVNFRVQ